MRLFFTFVLLIAQHAFAFDFTHLHSGMSFADVKNLYPNAHFQIASLEFPDKNRQYFNITNIQHDGMTVFVFLNGYLTDHAAISEYKQKILVSPRTKHAEFEKGINRFGRSASRPFQEQLLLSSVIWKPNTPMPLGQVFKQFGMSDGGDGISTIHRAPFIRWKKGIDGYPAANGKAISFFEFWFSNPPSETWSEQLRRGKKSP